MAVTNLGTSTIDKGTPGQFFRDYTFTFSAKTNPAFNGKDLELTIETDAVTGKDSLGRAMKQQDLDALFEAAAKASIKQ